MGVREEKAVLRKLLRERRVQASQAGARASLALRDIFLSRVSLSAISRISSYVAQPGEIDPAPLEAALRAQGHVFCLPCVMGEERGPLVFRACAPGDVMRQGFAGIDEPADSAPIIEPDVLLVPLLGFDAKGGRLGQGGGFYDRTLAFLRRRQNVRAIGLAYAAQEVPSLPLSLSDEPLDLIVTEEGVIDPVS